MNRHCRAALAVLLLLTPALAWSASAQQPPTEPQEQFLPLDQLPPQDQLPAAPLLIAGYSFVLVALFVYIISVSRRMGTVQREIERLESDFKRGGRT